MVDPVRIKCNWCHGHFQKINIFLRDDKRICEWCLEEIEEGLRQEPDCPECLNEERHCNCKGDNNAKDKTTSRQTP